MLRRRSLSAAAVLAAATLLSAVDRAAARRYDGPDFTSMFHREAELLPFSVGGRYGFVDSRGRVAVRPRFDRVNGMVEGAAAFRVGGRWGVVGRNDRVLMEPAFDDADIMSEGMIAVAKGDRWTYLSTAQLGAAAEGTFDVSSLSFDLSAEGLNDGEILSDAVGRFHDGFAVARLLRDREGRPANRIVFMSRGLQPWAPGRLEPVCRFDAGIAAVRLSSDGVLDPGISIIDTAGRRLGSAVGTLQFGAFSEGLAAMCDEKGCGFVDRTGAVAFRADGVSYSSQFHDGLAPVRTDGGSGFVDTKGRAVIPPKFRSVGDFRAGYAAACAGDERCGYIDRAGRAVIPLVHGDVVGFTAGVFVVGDKKPGEDFYRYSYLGKDGKPVMKDVFSR